MTSIISSTSTTHRHSWNWDI